MDDLLLWIVGIVVAVIVAAIAMHVLWRLRSVMRIWRAGEAHIQARRAVIWRAHERPESLDLAAGAGGADGAPAPPFIFLEEHLRVSHPCVSVRDGRGRRWRVKWGNEVQVESLATRLAWAAGYFVEPTYFVAEGQIRGLPGESQTSVPPLKRASRRIDNHGRFTDARFELDQDNVVKHFDEHSWAWNDNPFVGTRELNGLKIVMMWLSNWDAKDVRDVARGSNTAIFEFRGPDGRREARYLIIDWGGALGRWGNIVNRGRWDVEGYAEQTAQLVQGFDGEFVKWGYSGQRTTDITEGIRTSDVQWLMETLGRITDEQIADAVRASGGTPEEVTGFTQALRDRLNVLRHLVSATRDQAARSSKQRTAIQPFSGH